MLFDLFSQPQLTEPLTYISLFSSAGVGCYGFKQSDFECIATNEIIPRRLAVQKFNNKCRFDSGYIDGDLTAPETQDSILREIRKWETCVGIKEVDVLIATPPCQGMSVANHKKAQNEIVRNSLVIESIKMIMTVRPRFFIFENVPAFIKTVCTDIDGKEKSIGCAIQKNLGLDYSFTWKVINFKDYGACSSRSRTLVIGVRRDLADVISPFELFPDRIEEKTLRNVIGDFPRLKIMGEIQPDDFYHCFRAYPEHMREWIHDLKEGESAFEQSDEKKRPHRIVEGERIENANKNGDKYRRQVWDKVGPCVHTRNDQLASQNTVHPEDDRVFSIRELMTMMTIPSSFRWVEQSVDELNSLPDYQKRAILKKEEIKIRQSLGEAVPTIIFYSIAQKIKNILERKGISAKEVDEIASKKKFSSDAELLRYLQDNPENLSLTVLIRIAELANSKRTENSAYYTNKSIITEILHRLPDTPLSTLRILEPSVGVGSFIPLIAKRFSSQQIQFDVVDIDPQSIEIFKALLPHMQLPDNVNISIITADFLLCPLNEKYDYVIGNPPFGKYTENKLKLKQYLSKAKNKNTKNIFSLFLDKVYDVGKNIALVLPKSLLNAPEFSASRDYISKNKIYSILDFGESGFRGVLVETVALVLQPNALPDNTLIYSMKEGAEIEQEQNYITDNKYPYWLIYRNDFFDKVAKTLSFDCFSVFRDRQITSNMLHNSGSIRVVKARNIDDKGQNLLDIAGYDTYISREEAKDLAVFKYLNSVNVYMAPNMTYKPRVMKKPDGVLVNGSVALLFPKKGQSFSTEQLEYFSTEEYRKFYQIARNKQTRSLNIDSCSVYFLGVKES